MDSVTQIALGAAVGEAVLGRRMGHRALFWGAIGGTMPDLDVTANALLSEVDALAFHRSITHSFLFTALVPIPLAFALQWFYNRDIFKSGRLRRVTWWIASAVLLLFSFAPTFLRMRITSEMPSWLWFVFPLLIAAGFSYLLRDSILRERPPDIQLSVREGYFFFFLLFMTHILLDTATTYGTQLLAPFSSERFSMDFISVVDPLYSLPLLISLVIILFLSRKNMWRMIWNYAGLGISTAYLVFCAWHHARVMDIAEQSLKEQNIAYDRLKVTPTIGNNVLWNVLADAGDRVYTGSYSFFDARDRVTDFQAVSKGMQYLTPQWRGKITATLRWFSDNYFEVRPVEDGLKYHDLRFGIRLDGLDRQAFGFHLSRENGEVVLNERRPEEENMDKYLRAYWERLKGREVEAAVNPSQY